MPRASKPHNPEFPGVVLIDCQEQIPFTFEGIACDAAAGTGDWQVRTERANLDTADYTLDGYASRVGVERKSLADLFGTLGQGRERFVRELERLAEYKFAAVVVEADWRAVVRLYPPELEAMRRTIAVKYMDGADTSQPWGEWLAALDSIAPGPPPRSRLDPKTVFRSVLAWQQRYPNIHWWFCPNREFAEVTTLRILERWVKEQKEAAFRKPKGM